MTKRRLVDTNLIVRHLVQDHEKQARIAGKLFDFVDCLLAATAAAEDTPVATFDREFRRFTDVRVQIG